MRQALHLLIVDANRGTALAAWIGTRWLLPVLTCSERTRATEVAARWAAARGIAGEVVGQWFGSLAPDAMDWLVVSTASEGSSTGDPSLAWTPLATLSSASPVLEYQRRAIATALKGHSCPAVDGPFGDLTWPAAVKAWTEAVVGPCVSRVTYRAGPTEVVLGFATSRGRVYFKGLAPAHHGSTPGPATVQHGSTPGPATVQHGSTPGPATVQHGSTGPATVQHGSTRGPATVHHGSTRPATVQHGSTPGPATVQHGSTGPASDHHGSTLGPDRTREPWLTQALAALVPDAFARTLALETQNDGCVWWLTTECPGRPASDSRDVMSALARIQQQVTADAAVCRELPAIELDAAIEWAAGLLLDPAEVAAMRRSCCRARDAEVPRTWIPLDLDPTNVLIGADGRVRFIDLDDSFFGPAPLAPAVWRLRRAEPSPYRAYEQSWAPPLRSVEWSAFEVAAAVLTAWLGWERLERNTRCGQVCGMLDAAALEMRKRLSDAVHRR